MSTNIHELKDIVDATLKKMKNGYGPLYMEESIVIDEFNTLFGSIFIIHHKGNIV